MLQKPFQFAALCVVSCLVLVLLLYAFARKPNDHKNGFTRRIPAAPAVMTASLALKYPAYYIAGSTDQHLYLGNYSASLHLLTVSRHLKDTQQLTLITPPDERYAWKQTRLIIDSPTVYMAEGSTPALYQGKLADLHISRFLPQSCFFNLLQHISPTSFIARSIYADSTGNRRSILAKITRDSPYVHLEKQILQQQVDGIFCTDGTLDYDRQTGKLVYLYHYRNEFITLDTNLQVIYTGHTLDTNTTAKLQVANMANGVSKFSAPPTYVNNNARIADGRIYVRSSLLADNEDRHTRQHNDIIDVFSVESGAYVYTLYIPMDDSDHMTDFIVKDDQLFALYEHTLTAYTIEKR